MRNRIIGSLAASVLAMMLFSSIGLAQAGQQGRGGRGNTAWLLEDGIAPCTVDFGPTALVALKRLGRDPQRIAAIHLTHLHGDHIGGIPMLLVDAVYRAHRTAPLDITGPPGTAERVQALWRDFYADAAASELEFELRIHELRPGDTARIAGRRKRMGTGSSAHARLIASCRG